MSDARTITPGTGVAVLIAAIVLVAVGALVVARSDGDGSDEVDRVRDATEGFEQLGAAERAGYAELADNEGLTCIEDPGGAGAMGTHFVNGGLVGDGVIDAERPEALLYDRSGGKDRLLGVEYVVMQAQWKASAPPELFGHRFRSVNAPNRYGLEPFYELHAWVWEDNPAGMFDDWNPRIDC